MGGGASYRLTGLWRTTAVLVIENNSISGTPPTLIPAIAGIQKSNLAKFQTS